MHSRHKSETLVLHGDTLSRMSLYSNPSSNTSATSLASISQVTGATTKNNEKRQPEVTSHIPESINKSGFSYLASVAAEESRKLKAPIKNSDQKENIPTAETASNGHSRRSDIRPGSNVQFQLSPDFRYPATKSAEQQTQPLQSSFQSDSNDNGPVDNRTVSDTTSESGEDVTMLDVPHQEKQRSHKQGVHFMISDAATSKASVSPKK